MARTRRPETEDEEILDAEYAEAEDDVEEAAEVAAPVSDRRRRRQMKRGELAAAVTASAATTTGKGRPTPSQRDEDVAKESRNPLVRFFQRLRIYAAEVRAELQKVAWPSPEEVNRLTRIVLIVSVISAIFLGLFSLLFGFLTSQITDPATSGLSTIIAIALIIVVAGLWLFNDRLFGDRSE
ncbi:MAG: hypothetical protein OHK0023_24390 [Anaerolineae bacterium]